MIRQHPVIAELNGAPTDNNAKLFAQGYNGVLNPLYKNGTFKKGPNQSVPQWDNQKALTIFQGMLTKTNNKIDAVLAANDGLGNAAISALKSAGLKPIPVTGQDATAQGIQNIISGWQCRTVYKAISAEASAAATVADGILNASRSTRKGKVTNNGVRNVPSVLATPVWLTKNNWTRGHHRPLPQEERRLHRRVRAVLLEHGLNARAGRHTVAPRPFT